MPLSLHLFGAPQIEFGGVTAALPPERRHQLAALLALRRTWVGRAELAALLWPELDSRLAFTNLRKTLFRLQSLPWGGAVEVQGSALRLLADTDVAAFDAALLERRIDAALGLARGDLLEGFDDGSNAAWSAWLGVERDRLRSALRSAVHARLEAEIDPADAVSLSAWLLEADPLDETALAAHMTWLARAGQANRARQAYRDFAALLAQDFGLAPSRELRALHDAVGMAAVPAAATPTPPPAVAEDGFVGRAAERRQVAALLAQADCRLVSLVGPGGVGKTRLARRLLQELAPGWPDGAVFVALEDVPSVDELGARLARDLGVALAGSREALDQVISFLQPRTLLLVLDNAEHLTAAAPAFERVLLACPQLKMIVTSRVRLALAREWLVPVEGLPCPDVEDQDEIEAFDAARLFVQAARRTEPALVPAAEAAAIVDICRQVEGLPLALELAATWTRVLSCSAIAAELRRGTELLHSVDPTRPARHASIEVVFEQSWQRLGAAERAALARLSVFRGGFTADAARAVAGVSLPVLGALADKSLLRKERSRLFMHPLVQQLAALRLDEAAQRETARAAALYFHALLAQWRRRVEDGERDALQTLDDEFENCRNAWSWSTQHASPEATMKSAPTLMHYCDHRGRFEEGLALFRAALDGGANTATTALGALLLAAAAHLAYRLDRYVEAEAGATQALAATRPQRDHDARMQCFKVLGGCALRVERLDIAGRHYRHALRQARAFADAHNTAAVLGNLALIEKALGHYDEALRLSLQSLVEHRQLGDPASEALCLNNLGSLYNEIGQPEVAQTYLQESLALCDSHGFAGTRTFVLTNLTEIAVRANDAATAQVRGQRALESAQATGNRPAMLALKLLSAGLALRRDDLAAMRADVAAAAALAGSLNRTTLQMGTVVCFAELLAAQGETACARRVLAFATAHPATRQLQRDEIAAILARWPTGGVDDLAAWPGLSLEELIHRIAVEAELDHAPLIGLLRAIA